MNFKECPLNDSKNIGADYILLNKDGQTFLYNISELNTHDLYTRDITTSNFNNYDTMLNKLVKNNINPSTNMLYNRPNKYQPPVIKKKVETRYSFWYDNGMIIYIIALLVLVIVFTIFFLNLQ